MQTFSRLYWREAKPPWQFNYKDEDSFANTALARRLAGGKQRSWQHTHSCWESCVCKLPEENLCVHLDRHPRESQTFCLCAMLILTRKVTSQHRTRLLPLLCKAEGKRRGSAPSTLTLVQTKAAQPPLCSFNNSLGAHLPHKPSSTPQVMSSMAPYPSVGRRLRFWIF